MKQLTFFIILMSSFLFLSQQALSQDADTSYGESGGDSGSYEEYIEWLEKIYKYMEKLFTQGEVNLEELSYDPGIDNFRKNVNEIFKTYGRITGVAESLSTLLNRLDELYPDFTERTGLQLTKERVQAWLRENERISRKAVYTAASVLDRLPKSRRLVVRALKKAKDAQGNLEVQQAIAHINTIVAGQLVELNASVATLNQLKSLDTAERTSKSQASLSRVERKLQGLTTYKGVRTSAIRELP